MCSSPLNSSLPRIPQKHKVTGEVLVLTCGHTFSRMATAHNLHAMTFQTSFHSHTIQLTTMRQFADVCLNARLLQSLRFLLFSCLHDTVFNNVHFNLGSVHHVNTFKPMWPTRFCVYSVSVPAAPQTQRSRTDPPKSLRLPENEGLSG